MKPFFSRISDALNRRDLAADTTKGNTSNENKKVLPWKIKAVSRVRQDVKTWNDALNTARSEEPKNFALQLLYDEVLNDALLASQMENRKQQIPPISFTIKKANGDVNEEATDTLKRLTLYRQLNDAMWDSIAYGYNLVELQASKTLAGDMIYNAVTVPRTNVVPQTGLFYTDYTEDTTIKYRELAEFGTLILEYDTGKLGLLNKVVSHVLFKRFAQSCWSELCEIYGIPPRVMKTNTQDPEMLKRAEQMMGDMGAAAWFIIDDTETFEFAESTTTNGDVYKNLINLCSNEISLLFSGAIIGQDTQNGNRSKDESSQQMLWQLVQSDMALMEDYWTTTNLPSLVKLGILKGDCSYFEFDQTEDVAQLWKFTSGALQYYNVNPEFIKEKFGVDVTGERQVQAASDKEKLQFSAKDFFD